MGTSERRPDDPGTESGAGGPDRSAWRWVGADPDDPSPDAEFRREVAALAREVMLAHGADPDTLPPPLERYGPGAREASDADPAAGAPVAGTPASGAPTSGGPEYFDIRATAAFAVDAAARALRSTVQRPESASKSHAWDPVLLAVARTTDGVTTARLARVSRLPPSTVSSVVGRLMAAGLVARRPMPADRRRTLVTVTPEGRRAAEQVAAAWRNADRRLLAGLSPAEVEELRRLLRRAAATLEVPPGTR